MEAGDVGMRAWVVSEGLIGRVEPATVEGRGGRGQRGFVVVVVVVAVAPPAAAVVVVVGVGVWLRKKWGIW
jgi:hypothetical protein